MSESRLQIHLRADKPKRKSLPQKSTKMEYVQSVIKKKKEKSNE